MWRWIVLAALLAGLVPAPAAGQYRERDGGRGMQQDSRQRDSSRRQERNQREGRREADRERRETLTPDERRELNRDIQRANREIYRKGRDNR